MSEDYRSTIQEIARAMAPGWERRRAFLEDTAAPVRDWLIRELAPQPGQTLLELAAGAGDTGLEAAAILGATGRLITTDVSSPMLDVARRRGADLGVKNVEYRAVDAERIELDSDSVDGVLCRFGYMLMAEPGAALAETRRVLRPGGRLAFAVWGPPQHNPYFTILGTILVKHRHLPPPNPAEPGIFALASDERIRALLDRAGFASVRTEQVPVRFCVADVDEYLNIIADTAGPIGLAVRALPDAGHAAVAADVADMFARFATTDGYRIDGLALCATAR